MAGAADGPLEAATEAQPAGELAGRCELPMVVRDNARCSARLTRSLSVAGGRTEKQSNAGACSARRVTVGLKSRSDLALLVTSAPPGGGQCGGTGGRGCYASHGSGVEYSVDRSERVTWALAYYKYTWGPLG